MKRFYRVLKTALAGVILILLLLIPVRLTLAHHQAPLPQAILTLGGGSDREKFTAEFAKYFPSLDIWVSSGINPREAQAIFQQAGIPSERVHLDYRAVDTVTNFTTLVADFQERQIKHLYLITSDFHMPRAKAIATLVLSSQGITFTPVSIPSNKPRESTVRIVRDSLRSLLWIVSGRTAANLKSRQFYTAYASR